MVQGQRVEKEQEQRLEEENVIFSKKALKATADLSVDDQAFQGHILLNRPAALNALTLDMVIAVKEQLAIWQDDEKISHILIEGAGDKAFCAGGDVVKVIKAFQSGADNWLDFFTQEYLMNVAIDQCKKPYIALVDGIVMGGGVGISIPGDHWITTDKTLFAMPETGLGLFPDVGGGWFLPRLPGKIGLWLALTGARLKAADLHEIGLASCHLSLDDISAFKAALKEGQKIEDLLKSFHKCPGDAPIKQARHWIDQYFSGSSVEAIVSDLKAAMISGDIDEEEKMWVEKQYKILSKKSPLSLKVTFQQLSEGAKKTCFADNMEMEYGLVRHMVQSDDFKEGVRSILIDKDHNPIWRPANLKDVDDKLVDRFFNPPVQGQGLFI